MDVAAEIREIVVRGPRAPDERGVEGPLDHGDGPVPVETNDD